MYVFVIYINGLFMEEMMYFMELMVDVGEIVVWEELVIVDKYFIGGVVGNCVMLIFVFIVVVVGLKILKIFL